MKLTCVVDNNVLDGRLWGEHGLSMLLESQGRRVLYDCGESGHVLLHNLKALSIDPASIDALVLSHGHTDHTGGLPMLAPLLRDDVPVHAHPDVFVNRFSGRDRHPCGLDRATVSPRLNMQLSAAPTWVAPGIRTSGEVTPRTHFEGRGSTHLALVGGEYVPDPYLDDMSLFLVTGAGTVVVCGCAHAGVLNVLDAAKQLGAPVIAVMGGTHLVAATEGQLREAGDYLDGLPGAAIYLGHCTGFTAASYILRRFASTTRAFGAGLVLEFADASLV